MPKVKTKFVAQPQEKWWKDDSEWTVEYIEAAEVARNKRGPVHWRYFIKWLDFSEDKNTWETAKSFKDCQFPILKKFWEYTEFDEEPDPTKFKIGEQFEPTPDYKEWALGMVVKRARPEPESRARNGKAFTVANPHELGPSGFAGSNSESGSPPVNGQSPHPSSDGSPPIGGPPAILSSSAHKRTRSHPSSQPSWYPADGRRRGMSIGGSPIRTTGISMSDPDVGIFQRNTTSSKGTKNRKTIFLDTDYGMPTRETKFSHIRNLSSAPPNMRAKRPDDLPNRPIEDSDAGSMAEDDDDAEIWHDSIEYVVD